MKHSLSPQERTIRLSFFWVVVAVVGVLVMGILGGILGQQLLAPAPPLLRETNDGLHATVQEVILSPSLAAAQIVEAKHRSIVLLTPRGAANVSQSVTAWLITDDGILVTTDVPVDVVWQAYDYQGVPVPIDLVGKDQVFGLTYFRLTSGVFSALDLRQDDAVPAHRLLMVERSASSFLPRAQDYFLREYVVAPAPLPVGVQRVAMGSVVPSESSKGSPLFDEEGKVAALLLHTDGSSLPVSAIQLSLNRLTQSQRERNPWQELGLDVDFGLQRLKAEGAMQMVAIVKNVQAQSLAGQAGIRVQDVLTAVDSTPFNLTTNLIPVLSAQEAPGFTLRRGDQELNLQLHPPLPSP